MVSDRPTLADTSTGTVLSLLLGSGSGSSAVTVAVFGNRSTPGCTDGSTVTSIARTWVVFAASTPRSQLMVPALSVHPAGMLTTVRPAGSGSRTATLVASDGPRLSTVTV